MLLPGFDLTQEGLATVALLPGLDLTQEGLAAVALLPGLDLTQGGLATVVLLPGFEHAQEGLTAAARPDYYNFFCTITLLLGLLNPQWVQREGENKTEKEL